HAFGRLAHLLHGRKEQADQDGDDGDHHQQLHHREGRPAYFAQATPPSPRMPAVTTNRFHRVHETPPGENPSRIHFFGACSLLLSVCLLWTIPGAWAFWFRGNSRHSRGLLANRAKQDLMIPVEGR